LVVILLTLVWEEMAEDSGVQGFKCNTKVVGPKAEDIMVVLWKKR